MYRAVPISGDVIIFYTLAVMKDKRNIKKIDLSKYTPKSKRVYKEGKVVLRVKV